MFSQLKQIGKKLLVSVLAFTMLGSAAMVLTTAPGMGTTVYAESETRTYGDFNYCVMDDGNAKIVSYTGGDAEVIIPSSVWEDDDSAVTVTEIAAGALAYHENVEKIVVPKTVKMVRERAFASLNKLKYVLFEGENTVAEYHSVGYDARYEYDANNHQMVYRYYKKGDVVLYGCNTSCQIATYASVYGFDYYTFPNNTSYLEDEKFLTNEKVNIKIDGNGGNGDNSNYKYTITLAKRMRLGTRYVFVTQSDIKPVYDGTLHAYFKISSPGFYRINVTIFDQNDIESTKYLLLTVYDPVKNNAILSYGGADFPVTGQDVTVTANATGGNGDYSYAFICKKGKIRADEINQAVLITDSKQTFTVTEPGDYQVLSLAIDSENRFDYRIFDMAVLSNLANTSTISKKSIEKGSSVTVSCGATGGTAPYRYAAWYKKSSATKWTTAQNYSSNTSITITPKYTATYNVSVKVKDANGTIKKKAFTVSVTDPLKNTSTVSAAAIGKGDSVKVTGSATGGKKSYQYAVWYKKSTASSWTKKSDYTKTSTFSITPKHTGKYTISVKVKDANGTVKKKTLTVNVNETLKNTSTISKTAITKGSSVKVTASATGGVAPYQFGVWYKKSTASGWTKKSDYTSQTTAFTVTPKYSGTYYIHANVKDANGTVKKKSFTVTVS